MAEALHPAEPAPGSGEETAPPAAANAAACGAALDCVGALGKTHDSGRGSQRQRSQQPRGSRRFGRKSAVAS